MSDERVLFVHAHPDDETISTGGTIATLVRAGAQVTVVTCTRGERGEVIPPELSALAGDPAALAVHRQGELAAAMAALGVVDHRFLGAVGARRLDLPPRRYSDSGMRWGTLGPEPTGDAASDALTAADPSELAADIATVIASVGATAVVSYDGYGGYGHPDHIAVQAAARHAAEVMAVPFWAVEPDNPPWGAPPRSVDRGGRDVSVDVTPVLDAKRSALHAYRSQLTVVGDTMLMPGGQVEPITSVERFHSDDQREPLPNIDWESGSIGTRIAFCLIGLALGAVVGALATVTHQATATVVGQSLPIGLIGGLGTVAALLVGLRLVFGTRIVPAVTAAGVLGAIALLALESVGGSVLIPAASALSYYWLYGPAVIAFFVLAWPNLRRRGAG